MKPWTALLMSLFNNLVPLKREEMWQIKKAFTQWGKNGDGGKKCWNDAGIENPSKTYLVSSQEDEAL